MALLPFVAVLGRRKRSNKALDDCAQTPLAFLCRKKPEVDDEEEEATLLEGVVELLEVDLSPCCCGCDGGERVVFMIVALCYQYVYAKLQILCANAEQSGSYLY